MRWISIVGVILILFGLVALLFKGIPVEAERESVKIGPVEARVEREREIPVPPAAAVASIVGGIVLLVIGARRQPL
jgi:hypothetical protein